MRRQGSLVAAAVALIPFGTFTSPIYVASPPADSQRVFVVERAGKIQVIDQGVRHQFLDISADVATDGERGLLSMAFAPDYATSGKVYVYDVDKTTDDVKIEEFTRSATDPDAADPASRRVVLERPHSASNHNGGQLQFGPDGYLYATVGDNATSSNAQDLSSVYGKVLRIDPRSGATLAPSDNPFVSGHSGDAPLIWSYGLRNPWRFSFDSATGDLVIADVGQSTWEEVDWAPRAQGGGRGLNYGWPTCEGFCTTAQPGLTDPVLAYDHSNGACAIVGGYVVHAGDLPSLAGRYVYGDYCTGAIRSAALATPQVTDDRAEGLTVSGLFSFGQDSCGHLYALSGGGSVYRVSEDAQPTPCPAAASAPGAVQPAPGGSSPSSSSSSTPPPTPQAAPADTTPPTLFVAFRRRQRVARTRRLVVGVRCSEACSVSFAGSLPTLHARLTAGTASASPAMTTKLVLHPGRRALVRIKRALHSRRPLIAQVRIGAHDGAGNAGPARTVSVRIVR